MNHSMACRVGLCNANANASECSFIGRQPENRPQCHLICNIGARLILPHSSPPMTTPSPESAWLAAMHAFQCEVAANPDYMDADTKSDRGPYLQLSTAMERFLPLLVQNKLFLNWSIEQTKTSIICCCKIWHTDGHYQETRCSANATDEILPPSTTGKKVPAIKQAGAAIAYLQRYTMFAALGIVADREKQPNKPQQKPETRKNAAAGKVQVIEMIDKFRQAVATLPADKREKINDMVVSMSPTGKKGDFPLNRANEVWREINDQIQQHNHETSAAKPPSHQPLRLT